MSNDRDPRAARERFEMALQEARELVDLRKADVRRCLEQGLAWSHATVRTHRARLAAAIADVAILGLLLTEGRPTPLDTRPPPRLLTRGKP